MTDNATTTVEPNYRELMLTLYEVHYIINNLYHLFRVFTVYRRASLRRTLNEYLIFQYLINKLSYSFGVFTVVYWNNVYVVGFSGFRLYF